MTKKRNIYYLILPILILALAALACSGGTSTTHKLTGNSGETRLKMKEADGSNSTKVEINEDWVRERVAVTATLSVETGSVSATLTGEDGTIITMNASAGNPAQVYGDLVTDVFGDLSLVTEAQGVTNLELFVQFALK